MNREQFRKTKNSKVLILPPIIFYPLTGGARRTLELYSRMTDPQVSICIDIHTEPNSDAVIQELVSKFSTVIRASARFDLHLLSTAYRVFRAARDNDLIICYGEFPLSVIYSFLVSIISRKPFIIICHLTDDIFHSVNQKATLDVKNILYKLAIDKSKAIFCLDNGDAPQRIAKLLPRKQIYTSYNGVNTPPSGRIIMTEKYDGIFIGWMSIRKGTHLLPIIWAKVVKQLPGAKLIVVGKVDEYLRTNMEEEAKRLGILDLICVEGFVNEAKKQELIASSKVLLFPSSQEGIPAALTECLSLCKPAVAWDIPALSLFQSGVVKVMLNDLDGFADAVVNLLKNGEIRIKLGLDGKEFVTKNLSWEKAVKAESDSIYEVIGRKQ